MYCAPRENLTVAIEKSDTGIENAFLGATSTTEETTTTEEVTTTEATTTEEVTTTEATTTEATTTEAGE